MNDQEFLNDMNTANELIKEGYAYAISTQWLKKFENCIHDNNTTRYAKLGKIENQDICDTSHEFHPNLDGYNIPLQHSTTFSRVYTLKSDAKYEEDYEIVSIEYWKFFKKYYNADYDVVVFVTKTLPNLKNYFHCKNLDHGLCICTDVINLILVIVQSDDKSQLLALKLPASPWLELVKFRTYLFAMTVHQLDSIKLINEGYLYYKGKKVPFKGNKNLNDMGISQNMQILISCSNLIKTDIEEEIETDGDEQQIEQNIHTKQEFLEILHQNLNQQSTQQLTIKSISEIKQSLEQSDFFLN